jgi:hypothetical protein
MASKTNRTSDGQHVQFGDTDTTSMPEGFTAPDNGSFCAGYFGQVMENEGGGFGSAYIAQDDD